MIRNTISLLRFFIELISELFERFVIDDILKSSEERSLVYIRHEGAQLFEQNRVDSAKGNE